MAKIEIKGSPEELMRISTFLENNNVKFKVVSDFGNHSLSDTEKFQELVQKFQ